MSKDTGINVKVPYKIVLYFAQQDIFEFHNFDDDVLAVAGKIADREDHQSSAAPQKTSPAPQMPISSAEGLDMEDEDGDLDFFKRLANNNE